MTTRPGPPTAEATGPATPSAALVHIVDDHASVTRDLHPDDFTDLTEGRLGVLARPGTQRVTWLTADLLIAMGCTDAVDAGGRPGKDGLDNVVAWARARQVQHLFVQNSWLLSPPALDRLLIARTAIGCQLWLVGDTPLVDALRHTIEDHAQRERKPRPREVTGEAFMARWSHLGSPHSTSIPGPATSPGPATEPGHGLGLGRALTVPAAAATDADQWRANWPVTLPNDDFTTFLAACRALLTPAVFAEVHEYFRDCAAAATDAIADLATDPLEREQALARWLHERWEDIESWQHFLVLIRATQVALFHARFLMRVDPHQVAATASTLPRRATRNPEVWARLAAYREPYRGAACALAAAGLTVAQMRQLTVADAEADGTRVRLPGRDDEPGRWIDVEPAASVYVRAQREWLQFRQAPPSSPFLPAVLSAAPLSELALSKIVAMARREYGVAVASRRLRRTPAEVSVWFTRWGIALVELPS